MMHLPTYLFKYLSYMYVVVPSTYVGTIPKVPKVPIGDSVTSSGPRRYYFR